MKVSKHIYILILLSIIFLIIDLLISEIVRWYYISSDDYWFMKKNGLIPFIHHMIIFFYTLILERIIKKNPIYKYIIVVLFSISTLLFDFLYQFILVEKLRYSYLTTIDAFTLFGFLMFFVSSLSFLFYQSTIWVISSIKISIQQ